VKRVLVVDEYEPSRRAVLAGFERRGYACEAVASEQEALVSIDTFDPDVIVLEWALQRQWQLGLAARLRDRAHRPVCIIVVSYANEPNGFVGREQVDAYLTKPALVEEIEATFTKLLEP
jgi:DNA-binding response OmpR family regulator